MPHIPESTVVTFTNVSGTSFTLSVPSLTLDTNLSTLDFIVTHAGVDVSASYTKTSATQLTYSGTNVTLGTLVRVVRSTAITPAQTTFITTTSTAELSTALNNLRKRVDEIQVLLNYQTGLLLAGGVSVGANPVNNNVYGAGWDNQNTVAPSQNAVYDKLATVDTSISTLNTNVTTKANIASPAFSGVPTAPTPAYGTSDTQLVTRAFVRDAFVSDIATASPSTLLTTTYVTFATLNLTIPANARFLLIFGFARIFSTTATSVFVEVKIQLGGVDLGLPVVDHSHATGGGLEHMSTNLNAYRLNPSSGVNSITLQARASTGAIARLEQCSLLGLAIA